MLDLLKQIPLEAWVALVTAILTSALTLLGVWITNRSNSQRIKIQLEHDRKQKNEELKRERLEELYVQSKKYLNMLIMHYVPFRDVMNGEISFNQALDINIENGKTNDFEPHRVSMLIDLYFPELKLSFNSILELRDKLNILVDDYKEQYKLGRIDGQKWLPSFQFLLEEITEKAAIFDNEVVKIDINNIK